MNKINLKKKKWQSKDHIKTIYTYKQYTFLMALIAGDLLLQLAHKLSKRKIEKSKTATTKIKHETLQLSHFYWHWHRDNVHYVIGFQRCMRVRFFFSYFFSLLFTCTSIEYTGTSTKYIKPLTCARALFFLLFLSSLVFFISLFVKLRNKQ